ncbi:MAG: Peptidoglycan glycosyltransferase [Candidatus Woesebacteria bacterium GW2011_GWB1_44_11]|uniref:Peptidoglycan glycosyltransferase n=1 Tax=Candidatus Woesebacteria bacterium GW2011_GWB1_44_11 TaxID=1618579 RepID=A0A837I5D5_9BACT|nr:MAG: Peptidoglycan glycosyltransferase [Candidatus Woesebacteria bacterium GW2011_GWB1_44_11]
MLLKIRILSIVFLALFVALSVRLFYWQVIKRASLSDQAKSQYTSSQIIAAPRGNILASDKSFWVVRTQAWLIWVNPRQMELTPREIANKLSPFFVDDTQDKEALLAETQRLETILGKEGVSWIALKQKVNEEVKRNIEALKIEGLGFDAQESSYYPEASSAAQILGFVGKDERGSDIGYFGIEGYYDLPLSGKPGFVGGQKDAFGSPILLGGTKEVNAISGVDLEINVDKRIQVAVEKGLAAGIEKYGALGGSVTVMDPADGSVMAMASLPSFDPARYSEYSDSLFKNPIISDSFEPGSILKVAVMAAGLDAGVVQPDTSCDICSNALKVDKYLIKTWNDRYHPGITMTDVIVESDNVGMSFVGQKLGADRLYDYLHKFGIGEKTGIDLQGEIAPRLRERGTWNVVDLATASFGQGVAVTGIEMVRAVAAIANGGYLVTPRVVEVIRSDGWEEKVKPSPQTRIISEKAASEVTQMMVEAVERGEAKWTRIPGFKVAGKTGTAQIPVAGHYDAANTNHSFIGFAPAENPKFVMLVTLNSPQSSPWAAETAAPVWFSIAKELFPYLGVAPSQ